MRQITFSNNSYYHVYNRGVDKRDIYNTDRDRERFLYLLYAANDIQPIVNLRSHYRGFASVDKDERKRLVDIVAFCFMQNHYHLLLRQQTEKGISQFMQKLGTAYTMYFNTKYERSGVLFQGVFKAIHIDKENYLTQLSRYIHLNPVELQEPHWKKRGIHDHKTSLSFAETYPWSSYCDYLGKRKFRHILNHSLISELFLPPKNYKSFVGEWIIDHLHQLQGYTLE